MLNFNKKDFISQYLNILGKMKIIVLLYFVLLFPVLGSSISLFSQESKTPILVSIEDSLREKLHWEYDSTWINTQLGINKSTGNFDSSIQYKLVKIGKENFYEGPFYIGEQDTIKLRQTQYGDSILILRGMKFYTYIGNSSWGYYPTYHLIKIKSEIPLRLSNEVLDQLKIRLENTCEHGWNKLRGQACPQCIRGFRIKHDTTELIQKKILLEDKKD
mgnify:FL=1